MRNRKLGGAEASLPAGSVRMSASPVRLFCSYVPLDRLLGGAMHEALEKLRRRSETNLVFVCAIILDVSQWPLAMLHANKATRSLKVVNGIEERMKYAISLRLSTRKA